MHSRTAFLRVCLAFLCLGGAPTAFAAVVRWDNPSTGFWNDPINWENDILPGNDEAQINNGGTAVIDATQNVSTGFAVMGATAGTTGTLSMTGGTLTTNFDIRVGGTSLTIAGGTGTFNQSGGFVFMNGGNVNVGIGPSAVGIFNMSGGAFVENSAAIFAVGNRGTGTVIQTGGTIYVRGASNPATAVIQLGRNTATIGASGSYALSGGTAAANLLQFGNAVQTGGTAGTSTFTLSGTGTLLTNTISIINTAAANTFSFLGGSLSATTVNIPLNNKGGVLSPATMAFGGVDISTIVTNPIGTTTFSGANSYVQDAGGRLAIDLGFSGNDFISIGSGLPVGTASLAGTVSVSLELGFDPSVGSRFSILAADTISHSATITGTTPSGNFFGSEITFFPDGREVLELVVVPEPATPLLITSVAGAVAMRRRRG
jgi:fibronectin-binding autotransporter adhesin